MELIYTMKCTKEAFFSFLCDNLKYEFGKEHIFVGLKTKKEILSKIGKKIPCEIELKGLDKNKGYKLEITSVYGKNTLEYLMLDGSRNGFELKYIEKYITNSKIKKYNNMILELVFGYFLKKGKIKKLKQIDEYLSRKNSDG